MQRGLSIRIGGIELLIGTIVRNQSQYLFTPLVGRPMNHGITGRIDGIDIRTPLDQIGDSFDTTMLRRNQTGCTTGTISYFQYRWDRGGRGQC